jgi:hypothetical protein
MQQSASRVVVPKSYLARGGFYEVGKAGGFALWYALFMPKDKPPPKVLTKALV